MILLPVPKHVKTSNEILILSNSFQLIGKNEVTRKAVIKLKKVLDENAYSLSLDSGIKIEFIYQQELIKEQYKLIINQTGIKIYYKNESSAYNATTTLKQIFLQSQNSLSYIEIIDEPDLDHRGLLLDISRNRVFKVETLLDLIDQLSDLKLNELQLYIEGNPYFYPSKSEFYESSEDVLTADDIRRIDAHCQLNCMRLIPNQNSLGHMSFWLSKQNFKDLAECPDGFTYKWMVNSPPSTLNPLLPESFEFVVELFDELLEGFSEKIVNINADEPFELGFGASKEACLADSKGKVYLDYILRLKNHLKEKGFNTMLWGDVIRNYPELLEKLPKDIIALDWGYDINDFTDERCQVYIDSGIDYYVCPGTSMWNSIAGIHYNMLGNIKSAARVGKRNKAIGLLNTDWGDGGSWQPLSLSLFPYLVGCSYSWNSEVEQDEMILRYMDLFIFKDKNKSTAQLLYDLGNYSKIEKVKASNATQLFKLLYIQQTDHFNFDINLSDPMAIIKEQDKLSHEEYLEYIQFFKGMLSRFDASGLASIDQDIISDEILYSIKLLLVGSMLGGFQTDLYSHNIESFKEMTQLLQEAIEHFKRVWLSRNKKSDFKLSIRRMELLYKKFKLIIEEWD